MNKGPERDFVIICATEMDKGVTVVLDTADTPAQALQKVAEVNRQSWTKKRRVKIAIDEVKR